MHSRKKQAESSTQAGTGAIRPLVFAPSDNPSCREIADSILAALHDDYANAVCVASLAEIQEYATLGPVIVVPLLMSLLDSVARFGHVFKHNVAIVGWFRKLGMAHWDQNDVEAFLRQKGFVISSDFRVDFGLNRSHLQGCTDTDHRHLSVGVLEGAVLKCLPVVEVPNDAEVQQTMYSPGPYLPAQLDTQTELITTEIATALHQQFCLDYSRTELTLEPSGRLVVSAFILCPLLSSGSLMAWAAKLAGLSFGDLTWEVVTNAAGRRFGVVDVHSDAPNPGGVLSNFFPHNFRFDGVDCGSVEGLLQSLKYQNPTDQTEVAKLVGSVAKHAGARQNEEWLRSGLLWWRGDPIERHSERYQLFLRSIYDSVFAQSPSFRDALMATCGRVITHRVGMRDASQTVLTEREFVRNLTRLRSKSLNGSST